MGDSFLEFKNLIPANSILTLSKGVSSFFTLLIENTNELWITKYTKDRSVIWHRKLGVFGRVPPIGTYALMEDEQAFIHIVIPYSSVFLPHFNNREDAPLNSNTIVATLTSDGNIFRINRKSFLSNYRLVKIVNDVWLLANEPTSNGSSIMLTNLTKNSFTSNIFSKNYIDLTNVFHKGDTLFILLLTDCNLTYRGKTIEIHKLSAVLILIDTIDWGVKTWFRANSILPLTEECEGNPASSDCDLFIIFSSIVVTDHYFISAYTNSKGVEIYNRNELIKELNFEHDTTLAFIKITVEDRIISYTSLPIGNIELRGISQLVHMVKDNHIIFATSVSDTSNIILEFLNISKRLHTDNYFVFLRFTQDLEFRGHLTIGSGGEIPILRRACSCGSDCTTKSGGVHCSRVVCRITRLFPPGFTQGQGSCTGYAGTTCENTYNGSVPHKGRYPCSAAEDSGKIAPCGGQNYYTSFNNNKHCLAKDNTDQPGDLYNTKFASPPMIISNIDSAGNTNSLSPTSLNSNFMIEEESSLILGGHFIDTIIANGEAREKIYNQKLFGFLANIDYN